MKSKPEILKLLGGIPEDVYDAICASFFEEAKGKIQQMQEAQANSDFKTIALLAHGIKGTAGNLYFEKISEAAKLLETAAKLNDIAQIQQLFPILKSSFDEFQT